MTERRMLNDAQWLRIADLLPGKPTDRGGRAADNRLFVEAVLYLARTGAPWRDLPQALQGDADLEELFIDSTIVRAHQHSAGAPKKTVAIKRLDARGVV